MGRFRPYRSVALPISVPNTRCPDVFPWKEFVRISEVCLLPRSRGGRRAAACRYSDSSDRRRRPRYREYGSMRAIIALIVIIYIVGIGVALSPTIEAKW